MAPESNDGLFWISEFNFPPCMDFFLHYILMPNSIKTTVAQRENKRALNDIN